MEKPELEVRDLKLFSGKRPVVDIPHFELGKGECLVLFGPNGSGKSTFLRILSFLQAPDSGEIYYQGEKAGEGNRRRLSLKAVLLLQKPVFFSGTVRENLLLGPKFRGISEAERKSRLDRVAALFRLEEFLERSPYELSGGERQRVHLARAFILEPEILFLDEPFNGLDVHYREKLMADFYRIRRSTGVTTILVTHIREEALYLADRMAVMLEGRIVQTGRPEEISAAPATAEVSQLMGQELLVEGVVESSNGGLLQIQAHGQVVRAFGNQTEGERVLLTFRPEEVILAAERPVTSVRNWFYAEIVEIRPFDRMFLVILECGFRLKAFVSKSSVEELRLQPGKKVWAGVKASAVTTWPGRMAGEFHTQ
ncbi:MAG: ABC transporter ATP-binding protein [Candidatus Saccharicenans sp.]|nr:ABC transporter ATP-binding protein [Candidatus Saccharicenans sp.]